MWWPSKWLKPRKTIRLISNLKRPIPLAMNTFGFSHNQPNLFLEDFHQQKT